MYIGLCRSRYCWNVKTIETGFDNFYSVTAATVDMFYVLNAVLERNQRFFSNFSVWRTEFSGDLYFCFAMNFCTDFEEEEEKIMCWIFRFYSHFFRCLKILTMTNRFLQKKTTLMNNRLNACFVYHYAKYIPLGPVFFPMLSLVLKIDTALD